ncbi:MAG TPA: regulatory protein RecX [Candidatus Dormibacteraeota bacterium]|nr:regulatory protein RecX [Candidatus Dormibacteraeota bacterium]
MAGRSSRAGTRAGYQRRGRSPGPRKPTVKAFDAGIRLLARRPYGGAELGRRLLQLGYPEDEVRPALDTFVELGYINDATFAELHVARRAGKRGPRALAAELTARGVDRETVQQAVSRFDRDAQVRLAARLVRRDVGSNLPPTYQELLEAEGPKLLRRGYSHAIAWAACHAVWTGSEDLLLGA